MRSFVTYNAVELGLKVIPEETTIDARGGNSAYNVKSSTVSLVVAIISAVVFYKIQS